MSNAIDKVMEIFSDTMTEQLEGMTEDWQKPWITEGFMLPPRNLKGNRYNGINTLMLMFHAEKEGYKMPIYGTFKSFKALDGVCVKKDEKSFPIVFSSQIYVDKDTMSKISFDEYNELTEDDKKKYSMYRTLKHYCVFNIEQTNYADILPDEYSKLKEEFDSSEQTDGSFEFSPIDELVYENSWLCPIEVKYQDDAYYSIKKDKIVVPEKCQFKNGESFYGTLLHEMAHSTGAKSRLNRLEENCKFGCEEYAKEELIAELSSALFLSSHGITKSLKSDSIAYLHSWLECLKESPDFIRTVLLDVRKAVNMINERITRN